jgi:hypothetical protein
MLNFFQRKNNNFKGLTFIEVLISVFIMGLLVLSATSAAAIYLRNKSQLQTTQQAVEELNLIVNDIAKTIRMSNCEEDEDGNSGCFIRKNPYSGPCSPNVNSKKCVWSTVRSNENRDSITYDFYNGFESPEKWKLYKTNSSYDGATTTTIQLADNIAGRIFTKEDITTYQIPLVVIQVWKVKNGVIDPATLVETAVSQRGNYFVE